MSNAEEYFQEAELALAAYATLAKGTPNAGALVDAGMTASEANRFAKTWIVVDLDDSPTGLSATVFERVGDDTHTRYLAIRGTTPSDLRDLATDWVDVALFGTPALQLQYLSLKAQVQQWINDRTLSQSFVVAGHSLGGFLGAALSVSFAPNVQHAYLFNAPGFGGIQASAVLAVGNLLGVSQPSLNDQKISNIKADLGISLIAGLGVQLAPPTMIEIDGQTNTHSQAGLTTALAVYSLFARLDPALSINAITGILKATTSQSDRTLEDALDRLRTIFGFDGSTIVGTPDSLYKNFYDLLADERFTSVAGENAQSGRIVSLVGLGATGLVAGAKSDFGIFYALEKFAPFALINADTVYQATQADLYADWLRDSSGLTASVSDAWLADRAKLLQAVLASNIGDTQRVRMAGATDVAIEYEFFAGGIPQALVVDPVGGGPLLPRQQVQFADDNGRALVGTDYVRGDRLYGGAGADTLTGNKGADYLEGGKGADQYLYASGDGFDTIFDGDGLGSIEYDGIALSGGKQLNQGDHVWRSSDGKFVYTLASSSGGANTLTIAGPGEGRIEIENFHAGDLGITLDDALPTFTDASGMREIRGDWGYRIFSVNPQTGPGDPPPGYRWFALSPTQYLQIDDLGNVVRDESAPAYARADDVMYGSQGADHMVAASVGMDLYGKGGDDHLEGSSSIDGLFGGAGNDLIEGGVSVPHFSGDYPYSVYPDGQTIFGAEYDDILNGGSGNDTIFGETADDLDELLDPHTPALVGDGKGDVVLAGTGDDLVYGSTSDDALFGGAGKDVIVAGAGDDFLDGDDNFGFYQQTFDNHRFKIEPGSTPFEVRLYPVMLSSFADSSNSHYGDGPDYQSYKLGGDADILDGGAGNDTMVGMSGDDVLIGGTGDDVLAGWEADDVLEGGEGNDLIAGDFGRYEQPNQRLGGGSALTVGAGAQLDADSAPVDQRGKDFLDGGAGNDLLYGEAGDDVVLGGSGDDQMWGDAPWLPDSLAGADEMRGDAGDDVEDGGAGDDQLYGDEGADTLRGGVGGDYLDGGDGNDALDGGLGADVLLGGDGTDQLLGGEGDDYLEGGLGDDVLVGGDGADVLVGGAGFDVLRGGAGDDTYVFNPGDGREVVEDADGVSRMVIAAGVYANDISATLLGSTLVVNVGTEGDGIVLSLEQKVSGFEFADGATLSQSSVISGAATTVLRLSGAQGQALAIGTSGADTLAAMEWGEELYGGLGSDTYRFGRGAGNVVVLEEGDRPADVDRILVDNLDPSHLVLQRLGADLVLSIDGSPDTLTVRDQFSASAKIEQLEFADGTVWNAATIESRVRNLVIGSEDDDRLEGTPGSDLLEGGAGADTYGVDPAAPGTDLVRDLGGMDEEAYAAWYYASIGLNVEESRQFGGDWIVSNRSADLLRREIDNSTRTLGVDPFRETSDSSSFVYASLEGLQADLAEFGIAYDPADVALIEPLPAVPIIAANDYASLQQLYDVGLLRPDVIEFGGTLDDLLLQRSDDARSLNFFAGDHEVVEVQLAQPGDPLGSGIEWFSFADRSSYDLAYVLSLADATRAAVGTTGDDSVRGSSESDLILGLQGDDLLVGSGGDDVYFFGRGSGRDTIEQGDAGAGDADTLRLPAGISPADILVSRSGSAIVLTIAGTADSITLRGWFDDASHRIASIEFGDGTAWSAADLEAGLPNNAPVLASELPAQEIAAYASFTLSAAGAFVDPDEGDSLSYQAQLADGSPLPAWLLFDASTQTFSGTPSAQDVGTWMVTLAATDAGGLSASASVTIQVDPLSDPVIAGTAGDDSLVGTAGADRLDGGAGSDTMRGGKGTDTYVVDNPGDVVIEQPGAGVDRIESSVTYTLPDNVEQLTLTGSADIDGTGNGRANTIVGNSGANLIDGGGGTDTLIGGAGDDAYFVDKAADVVTENPGGGNDSVFSAASFTLGDNVETLVLSGPGSTRGTGNALGNVLIGNDANNVLDGSLGADTLIGRAGNDTYIVDNYADVVLEGPDAGKDLVRASASYALGDNVENLTLTGSAAIVGVGNAQDNVLTGNAAASLLAGGAGDDTYVVSDARNAIVELAGEGIDLVKSSVSCTLADNVENLTLTGTAGLDGFGNALDNLIRGNDADNLLEGLSGDDTLNGKLANDVLRGGDGNDVLRDNGGDNVLDGGSGNDNLSGKDGSDLLIGGAGDDALNTGTGADIIAFNRGDGQDKVAASTGADNVLSLGGGIVASDLSFKKSGSSLVLQLGGGDQITFAGWYATDADNRSVALLQLVGADGTAQTFDFLALAGAFDAARASNPKLKSWDLAGTMSQQPAGTAAPALPGSELALWYANNGSLEGLNLSCDDGTGNAAQTTTGDDGNDFLAGGSGNDVLSTGAGANVVAFNRGGGTDAVFSDASATNTLSMGGVRYDDLWLAKSGDDLVLQAGGRDNLVLKDWYAGNDDVNRLQLILDSTDQYEGSSADPLTDRKVETFDFLGLVARFDDSREQNPGLTGWALTNALLEFHLSGADDAALGGDLAYAYAHNGSLQGISPQAAQQIIGAPGFGSEAQQLQAFGGLQEGLMRIGV
jgi:Ca2+-binding RTX toxin-like protein